MIRLREIIIAVAPIPANLCIKCGSAESKKDNHKLSSREDRVHLTCLTVELVEKLQIAKAKGKSVPPLVQRLKATTLPGLIEYGCLRHAFPDQFPSVPPAIANSHIGVALADVRSQLGIRQSGPQRGPAKTLQPKPVEFYVLKDEDEVKTSEWNNFCGRLELGAKRAGFARPTALNLQFALHEMASNAVIHAGSPIPALVGYEVADGIALFGVADVGMGILASLRSCEKYRYLQRPVDAIQEALRPGVSRFQHGGFGFDDVFKAVATDWGELRFRSGNGCIAMDGTSLKHDFDNVKRTYPPALPGFQVSMCCRIEPPRSNEPAF